MLALPCGSLRRPAQLMRREGNIIMEKIKLDRINELAHKSKAEGLTPEEKAEQAVLRAEFLAEIRVKASLESIEFVEEVTAE